MGADCKSVGLAYEGSNPSPATPGATAPDPAVGGRRRAGAVLPSGGRGRGRWPRPCAPAAGRRGTASRRRSVPPGCTSRWPPRRRRPPTSRRAGCPRRPAGRPPPPRRRPGPGAGTRPPRGCRPRRRRPGWRQPGPAPSQADCTRCCSRKASEAATAPNAIRAATSQQTRTKGRLEPSSDPVPGLLTGGTVGARPRRGGRSATPVCGRRTCLWTTGAAVGARPQTPRRDHPGAARGALRSGCGAALLRRHRGPGRRPSPRRRGRVAPSHPP